MKCVRCGSELGENDKFCLGCGFEVGKEYVKPVVSETLESIMELQPEPEETVTEDVEELEVESGENSQEIIDGNIVVLPNEIKKDNEIARKKKTKSWKKLVIILSIFIVIAICVFLVFNWKNIFVFKPLKPVVPVEPEKPIVNNHPTTLYILNSTFSYKLINDWVFDETLVDYDRVELKEVNGFKYNKDIYFIARYYSFTEEKDIISYLKLDVLSNVPTSINGNNYNLITTNDYTYLKKTFYKNYYVLSVNNDIILLEFQINKSFSDAENVVNDVIKTFLLYR